jgi:hypothetical protein
MSATANPKGRERLNEQILAGLVAPWARVSIPGNFAVDKTRVDHADCVVAQADLLDHTGTEVLDHYVRARQQLANKREVIRVLQVSRVRLFVAIDGMKKCRIAIERQIGDIELAAEIASAWPLDLDDACAEIRHAQARGRARQELREVDNEQT